MIAIRIEPQESKLNKRRTAILKTLRYVQSEQRTLDENKDLMDIAAYVSRCELLGSLTDGYTNEIVRINAALKRITEGEYGLCIGCRERIDVHRLEMVPEATWCSRCQNIGIDDLNHEVQQTGTE